MFDTAIIEERLRDVVEALNDVRGAADYASVQDLRSFRPGTAYVVPVRERDTSDKPRNTHQVTVTFGVVIAARNYSGTSGSAALDDARPLVKSVRAALKGWRPARDIMSPVWVQGDVMDYDQNTLLWCDVFEIQYYQ